MIQALSMVYLWLKAGHIIFAIFWVAGLFMLPRLFVYHQETDPQSPDNQAWIAREQRLLRIILWPSLIVVWLLGLSTAVTSGAFSQGWFHIKLAVLLILTAYHVWMSRYASDLSRGQRLWSNKRLRLLNEVPGIAVAIIVVLAVTKPF